MNPLMKLPLYFILFFLLLAFKPQHSFKQGNANDATLTFKANGVCSMCKERIEEALYVSGIKSATWDKKTQMLTVSYKSKKINEMQIHQLVAGVGHDTEKVKAKDEVYKALPDCCLYRDGVNAHDDK